MLTLSEAQEQCRELADNMERADSNPMAIGPERAEIVECLRDVQDATNDDCETCNEVDKAAWELKNRAADASLEPGEVQRGLMALLVETGIFDVREAAQVVQRIQDAPQSARKAG